MHAKEKRGQVQADLLIKLFRVRNLRNLRRLLEEKIKAIDEALAREDAAIDYNQAEAALRSVTNPIQWVDGSGYVGCERLYRVFLNHSTARQGFWQAVEASDKGSSSYLFLTQQEAKQACEDHLLSGEWLYEDRAHLEERKALFTEIDNATRGG